MSETGVKGTFLGFDSEMQPVHVGDYVEHVEKEGFGLGVVTTGGVFYKDEVACKVDFENEKNWTARLSKLEVVEPPQAKPTLADFGFKVGDKLEHLKYAHLTPLTITSEAIGEYKGEPCCYTGVYGRPTRFSQVRMYVEPKVQAAAKVPTLVLTLPNGKIVKIDIE